MRIPAFLTLSILCFLFAGTATAGQKSWFDWVFTPSRPDFERRYIEDGKTPHNSQWENDPWVPEDWTNARGSKEAVLAGLQGAGIISDHEMGEGASILEVGLPFLRLSDKEKIHVVKYIDHVYGITANNGAMQIERDNGFLWWNGDAVGVYTAKGLQLQ